MPREFSSYGSRRGNDSVMLRAMFAHSRLDNRLTSKPGSHTVHVPSNSVVRDCFPFFMSVLDFLIFVLKISVSFFALYEPWHCNNRPVSDAIQDDRTYALFSFFISGYRIFRYTSACPVLLC